MNLNNLKKIYDISPNFIKKIYSLIPWNLRMGKEYRKTIKFLNQSLLWSQEQWKSYQDEKLRALLKYCYANIPYYDKQFQQYDINIYAKNIRDEFIKIPFINKELVTRNIKKFVPTNKAISYSSTTGGTTGKPMQTFYDKDSFGKEWAYKIFFWNRAIGYKPSDKKATFRGIISKNLLSIENPIYNEVRFSPFHMNEKNMEIIVKKLINYNPKYIHGYPSAIEQLANYIDKKKLKIKNLKGIILISENIYSNQKHKIEKIFDKKIFSFYGHSERVIFASMLDEMDIYYAHPAYGITELIDNKNNIIDYNDEIGEIVGTGFINKAMPLIRFKTGDYSSWSSKKTKVNFPKLNEIRGRWTQEYLIGKTGKKISLTSLNMHSEVFMKIKQFQYIQNSFGIVILNLIVEDDFNKEDEKNILKQHFEKLGNDFELKVCYVNNLQKTISGKIKFLIQDI